MTLVRYRAHDLSLKDNFGKGKKGCGPGPECKLGAEASSDWATRQTSKFECRPEYHLAGSGIPSQNDSFFEGCRKP